MLKFTQLMAGISARDVRSNTGSNIRLLQVETGLDPCIVRKRELKELLVTKGRIEVPKLDFWRPQYLRRLLKERREYYYSADVTSQKKVQSLIDYLCIN